jgi:glucose/arabinose dehydrogenase
MRRDRWLLVLLVASTLAVAGCADPAGSGTDNETADGDNVSADTGEPDGGSSGEEPDEPPAEPRELPEIELEPVAEGLERPTLVTSADDGTGRLFVLEQPGRVRVIQDGQLVEEPYLDLTDRIEAGGERGLLGLAFSPDFADTGHLYVSYTDTEGTSKLVRHKVQDPSEGEPSPQGTELLSVEQPYGNHNGGHVAFGPDGYLYYGLGDGGSGGDPEGNGQEPGTLLGSMLRLDVSGEQARAPEDNPFVGTDEGHDLVWAYGLRNPWRFTFDPATGDLFIGDVGQDSYEEVSHQPAASTGGENYGWNRWEANQTYEGDPAREGYAFPILEYAIEEGRCAVTGGYVYRGEAIPDLEGFYLYADFCQGTVWAAQNTTDGWRSDVVLETDHQVPSFGVDEAGELAIVTHDGTVQRIVAS